MISTLALAASISASVHTGSQPTPAVTAADSAQIVALQALRDRLGPKRIGLDTAALAVAEPARRRDQRRAALAGALGARSVERGRGRSCVANVDDTPACRGREIDVAVTPLGTRVVGDTAWVDVALNEGVRGAGVRAGTGFVTMLRMRLVRVGGRWQPGEWTTRSMT